MQEHRKKQHSIRNSGKSIRNSGRNHTNAIQSKIISNGRGEFDIVFAGWSPDYNDPMTYLDMFATGNGNNYGKYSNPEYDKLIADATKEVDKVKRQEMLMTAEN